MTPVTTIKPITQAGVPQPRHRFDDTDASVVMGNRPSAFGASGLPVADEEESRVTQQDNLINWWKFDEGSGVSAADSGNAGAGNTAAIVLEGGAAFSTAGSPGPHGRGSVVLDGVSDYLETSAFDLAARTAFSVSVWVKNLSDHTDFYGGTYSYGYRGGLMSYCQFDTGGAFNWGFHSTVTGAPDPVGNSAILLTYNVTKTGEVSNASNTEDITITSNDHGIANSQRITVSGVLGNLAANGSTTTQNVTTNTFELRNLDGNGEYGGGGTWYLPQTASEWSSDQTINTQLWHHYVATWGSGNVAKMYVDGALYDTGTVGPWSGTLSGMGPSMYYVPPPAGDKVRMGRRHNTTGSMNAEFADSRIYDIELSAADVLAIYGTDGDDNPDGSGDRG